MESIIYKEWRDQNSNISFPFIYNRNEIDNSYFIDASLAVYGATNVWLSSLSVDQDQINGELTDSNLSKYYFSKNLNKESDGMYIDIFNEYQKKTGKMVLGNFFNKINLFNKSFSSTFDENDILLNPTCLLSFSKRHLSSIQINNSNKISGFISIQEGPGVEINGENNILIFDALGKRADNLIQNDCECDNGIILKKINNIASSNPTFFIKQKDSGQPSNTLDKRQVIRINSIENGINIELAK